MAKSNQLLCLFIILLAATSVYSLPTKLNLTDLSENHSANLIVNNKPLTDTLFLVDGRSLIGKVKIIKKTVHFTSQSKGYKYKYQLSDVHKIHYNNGAQKLFKPMMSESEVNEKKQIEDEQIKNFTWNIVLVGLLGVLAIIVGLIVILINAIRIT